MRDVPFTPSASGRRHAASLIEAAVNGGGIDSGPGAYFANAGDDLHAVGSMAPLVPGYVGCIVIGPDGSQALARVERDLCR